MTKCTKMYKKASFSMASRQPETSGYLKENPTYFNLPTAWNFY